MIDPYYITKTASLKPSIFISLLLFGLNIPSFDLDSRIDHHHRHRLTYLAIFECIMDFTIIIRKSMRKKLKRIRINDMNRIYMVQLIIVVVFIATFNLTQNKK